MSNEWTQEKRDKARFIVGKSQSPIAFVDLSLLRDAIDEIERQAVEIKRLTAIVNKHEGADRLPSLTNWVVPIGSLCVGCGKMHGHIGTGTEAPGWHDTAGVVECPHCYAKRIKHQQCITCGVGTDKLINIRHAMQQDYEWRPFCYSKKCFALLMKGMVEISQEHKGVVRYTVQ